MKRIPLTQGKFAIVDDEDFEWLNKYKWCAVHDKKRWYAVCTIKGNKVYMHRMLLRSVPGQCTDHRNRDGLDNRKTNLRNCNHSQNMQNSKPQAGGTSKFKGVCWLSKRKKWQATIGQDYKMHVIGLFDSEVKAAKAYNKRAKELFGEFARLNTIKECSCE